MRRLAPLLIAVVAVGCAGAEDMNRAADATPDGGGLMLCLSDTSMPDVATCIESPSCNAWRRTVESGREVWRRARDELALENERHCRASSAYVGEPDPPLRPAWSSGGADEVSRALSRSD